MQICLSFDQQLMEKYDARGSPLFFGIAWEHEGAYYPDKAWMDLGAVIVDWWLSTVIHLWRGSNSDKFQFMDGPYLIEAEYDPRSGMVELKPENLDITWYVPLTKIVEELVSAAEKICRELGRIGIARETQVGLEKFINQLKVELRNGENPILIYNTFVN